MFYLPAYLGIFPALPIHTTSTSLLLLLHTPFLPFPLFDKTDKRQLQDSSLPVSMCVSVYIIIPNTFLPACSNFFFCPWTCQVWFLSISNMYVHFWSRRRDRLPYLPVHAYLEDTGIVVIG